MFAGRIFIGLVLPVLVLVTGVEPATGGGKVSDWPQFRGPGGKATGTGTGLPVKWTASDVRWKTDLPGPGASSPIIKNGKIFLTCFTGYGVAQGNPGNMDSLKRHVLCLDRASGKILWNQPVESKLPDQKFGDRLPLHGYASSTPVADDERVYAFFGKSGVFAFDHAGKQLWQTPVGDGIHGWGSGTSPVLFGDLVLVNACVESQSLVALDKKTGMEKWRLPRVRESWSSPLLVDLPGGKTEVIICTAGKIHGIDPATGKELWTCKGIGSYVCPTPVAHEGVVYAIGDRFKPTAVAVRAGGRGEVTSSHVLWSIGKGSVVPSPVFHNGFLYFAHDTLSTAYCVDAATGKVVYEERLLPQTDYLYPSPVVADGKLYYLSRSGQVFVLPAAPKFQILAVNDRLERSTFNASPVVHNGELLLRSDKTLYCIGKK